MIKKTVFCLFTIPLALTAAMPPQGKANETPITLDFTKSELPAGWTFPKGWKSEVGELRGEGAGIFERTAPLTGDFTITFDAWFEEKASIELKIIDAKADSKKIEGEHYTFAFAGLYHSVLDGVKSCILKGNQFVNVNPKMWIFPGRMFHFEVRSAKHQFQMFLNQELGPVFVDSAPPGDASYRIRFVVATEGKKDKVRIDNIKIETRP
ncbi:MAG: hypothetical protein ACKVS6_01545 [Planctomycetota bacterium]